MYVQQQKYWEGAKVFSRVIWILRREQWSNTLTLFSVSVYELEPEICSRKTLLSLLAYLTETGKKKGDSTHSCNSAILLLVLQKQA